jgi:hypothetical protein
MILFSCRRSRSAFCNKKNDLLDCSSSFFFCLIFLWLRKLSGAVAVFTDLPLVLVLGFFLSLSPVFDEISPLYFFSVALILQTGVLLKEVGSYLSRNVDLTNKVAECLIFSRNIPFLYDERRRGEIILPPLSSTSARLKFDGSPLRNMHYSLEFSSVQQSRERRK